MIQDSSTAQPVTDVGLTDAGSDGILALCQQIMTLAERWDVAAAQQLVQYQDNSHPFVRWQAGEALANMAVRLQRRGRSVYLRGAKQGGVLSFAILQEIIEVSLQDASPRQRAATADALGRWRHVAVTPLLITALRDSEPAVRVSAASALGQAGDDAAVGALVKALRDESLWVRRAAAEALGAIGSPLAMPALAEALQPLAGAAIEIEEAPSDGCALALVRAGVVGALAHFDTSKARGLLIGATEDADLTVRWQAVRGLARIGDVSALPALKVLLQDDAQVAGHTIANLAAEAIVAIERRQQGLGNWLRKVFYELWHGWRHRHRGES